MKTITAHLGIDVSKDSLDCALTLTCQRPMMCWKAANSPEGHASILQRLREHGLQPGNVHAVLEATGIYSQAVAEALHRAGIPTSVVNPRQVKDFGRSLNLRTKTDGIDSRLLARYGTERAPVAYRPPCASHKRRHAWVNELDAAVEERRRLLNRMESTLDPTVLASQKAALRNLERRMERIEHTIASLIAGDATPAHQVQLLVTIPGIALRTAVRVLSQIGDKHFQSARALAAYAGLTPSQHQSGSSVLKPSRLSKIGNVRLRRALYMPASVARRCCKPLQLWADSLAARGKAKKAVRGAVMRKLLHLIFGVLKNNEPFNPLKAALSSSTP